MPTAAKLGRGTKLYVDKNLDGTYNGGLAVAEVRRAAGPAMKAGDLDVSNLDSPNNDKEFIRALRDPANVNFMCNFTHSQFLDFNLYAQDGIVRNWKLVWTDGTTCICPAYVNELSPEFEDGTEIKVTVAIKFTGTPIIS